MVERKRTESLRSLTRPRKGEPVSLIGLLEESSTSLVPHLTELRTRLFVAIAALVFGSVCGWVISPSVLRLFESSVGTLIFISPAEGLIIRMKMAVVFGLILSSPAILHQIWRFVEPGLLPAERRAVGIFLVMGSVLFVSGLFFGYYVVYPSTLGFFLGFGTEGLKPAIVVSKYFGFFLGTTLSFGLAFQLPTIMLILVRVGLLDTKRLIMWRRPAIFTAFVVSAMLTPADVISQFLMAIPLTILYEITILLAPRFEKKGNRG